VKLHEIEFLSTRKSIGFNLEFAGSAYIGDSSKTPPPNKVRTGRWGLLLRGVRRIQAFSRHCLQQKKDVQRKRKQVD
jgi:hypothetical protein